MDRPDGAPLPQMHAGDEVPAQTSGKANAAGGAGAAGAAIGTILTAVIVGLVGDPGPAVHGAISVLGGTIGAGLAAYAGAYYKRNFLK